MQRRIELEGVSNFRDLGGYATASGKTVKWRTIFRSDTLSSLTDKDVQTVIDLGVNTTCDLRYGEERLAEPSRFLNHENVEVLELGLTERPSESFLDSFVPSADAGAQAHAYLVENYSNYPVLYADAYKTIFERLIGGDRLVVHCTAGKDRAGTAAALVLLALGVPREIVFEDYFLTNQYWDRGGREKPGMDAETVASIFSARNEYLSAALDTIDNKFGGIDTYLSDHLCLSDAAREKLRGVCLI